ncbi:MAG: hypothetical protein ACXWM7_06595 [Parachlamydiaceae bacterium]
MSENTKKKLCWNCEGNVSLYEDTCPYCRASILPQIDSNQEENPTEKKESTEGTSTAITMALLMGGTFFFLFGCLLYFFSEGDYFVLRWSNSYWFMYLLIALPMLYFGFQKLQHIPDD